MVFGLPPSDTLFSEKRGGIKRTDSKSVKINTVIYIGLQADQPKLVILNNMF